ncbi:MAG: sensor histidine kinase, partial [Bacteroidia bacterium]
YFSDVDLMPESFNSLMSIISQTYDHYEKDRKMIERSIDLSSKEMIELNRDLQKEKEELQKVHTELKQNELSLRQAQEIAHIGSWKNNFSNKTAIWSEEQCRIFGLPPNENEQSFESFLSFIHPEDLEFVKKISQISAEGGNSFYCRIIRKDGTLRQIYTETRLEFNKEGKPVFIYGITHDVTEQKLEEEKKQFNKRNLRALINNTSDPMWSVDRAYRLISSNKPFNEMVTEKNNKPIERQGNVLEIGYSPEEAERFKSYYDRSFAGEKFTVVEHSYTAVENWSEISFYPIYSNDTIIGTACFSKDITKRKLSEIKFSEFTNDLINIKNKLEYNELRFKQAQQIAHVGSWTLNFANGIALWSDEACRIYGLPLEENNKQSYRSWLSFIHPEDLDSVLKIIKGADALRESAAFYHRILRKDNTVKFVYSQSHFEFDPDGNVTGLYGVVQDVTEQKLAEQEILCKNKELRDLSNHIQNVREEERAFIAREIHDELGQQLTVLKMDIGWVMRKQNNPDQAVVTKFQEMLKFSDNLIATIRKISSDLRPAIIDDLGLIAALEWICDDFERKTEIPCCFTSQIRERKFDANFSITAYRILQESLTNIIRHAQAKSVTVSASENESELFLEIVDDGKGINNENIRKGKTLGVLGMKERAALLGGELSIKGIQNKGTKIKLILPINERTNS